MNLCKCVFVLIPVGLVLAVVTAIGLERVGVGSDAQIGLIGKPGQPVQIDRYLVTGKTTIVDFFSKNCPPCRAIAPKLERLAASRPDLAVRSVDVDRSGSRGIDFGSPVARQYEIESLPHFRIYGPAGKLELEGRPAYEQVLTWIADMNAPARRRAADEAPEESPSSFEAGS